MEVTKGRDECRCESGRLWFKVNSQGLVEVMCRYCSRRLKRDLGYRVVVFHYFDVSKRELVDTKVFRDSTELVMERR